MTVFCAVLQVLIYFNLVFPWVSGFTQLIGPVPISGGSQLVGGACSHQGGVCAQVPRVGLSLTPFLLAVGFLAGACCSACFQGLTYRLRNGHPIRPNLSGISLLSANLNTQVVLAYILEPLWECLFTGPVRL